MLNFKFFVDFLRYKKYQYIIKKNYNSNFNYNGKDSNYHNYINQLKTNGFATIENFVKNTTSFCLASAHKCIGPVSLPTMHKESFDREANL